MGNIQDLAIRDAKSIVTNKSSGWAREIQMSTIDGLVSATVNGLNSNHHLAYDAEGEIISSSNVHVSVIESDLVSKGYPVRINGKVSLSNHRVSVQDNTGTVRKYVVKDCLPDSGLGVIVLILSDYVG